MEKTAFRISVWLCLLTMAFMVMTSCKRINKDADIQAAFSAKSQTDPSLAGVTATAVNGTVTLSGQCADENCRANAEKAVKDIDGVKKVVNNITLAEVRVEADDPLRKSAVQVAGKYGVQAEVNNGVVVLRGTIDNREKLQQLMMELNALHAKKIDNQLVIKK
jgi:hyperosmotically inducible protein